MRLALVRVITAGRKMKRLRFLIATLAVAAGLAAVLGVTTAPAGAAYGPLAEYQVAISANCNNVSICGADGLGGFWGWAVFNTNGTADAELTGCGHLQGGGGGGASHMSVDASAWKIQNGTFWTSQDGVTYHDTGIPAAPGHYSTMDLFGMTAPGVSFMYQVTKIPNR
jgi:hypothetical protein